MSPAQAAEARIRQRFEFFKELYKRSGTLAAPGVRVKDLAEGLNISQVDADSHAIYLLKEGLVILTHDGLIKLTHRGIVEVEAALTRPQRGTEHFPSSVIFVENMTNSVIQQGDNNRVVYNRDPAILARLDELAAKVDQIAEQLKLSDKQSAELRSDVETLRLQIKSPVPKRTIILESLKSIRTILEEAGGNLLASGILHEINKFLVFLN